MSTAFKNAMNLTQTENGAHTLRTSNSGLVDLFAQGGALRNSSDSQKEELFENAFNEDKLLATKMAFYFRDVRGGQGERATGRFFFNWLADNNPDILIKNLENISFYGRYDDLIELFFHKNKKISNAVLNIIKKQLVSDIDSDNPSLLAKWLFSTNTHSVATCKKGYALAKALKLTPREYRKTLSILRSKINVLEQKMCAKEWDEINYEAVPSKASMVYKKAFRRNDKERYEAYLESVSKGEAKINSSVLYPYELIKPLVEKLSYYGNTSPNLTKSEILDYQTRWDALPNYVEGNDKAICVADTSGSMSGLPIQIAVSLAIYMAERNVGPFKDCWMNFSMNPTFQVLKGKNIVEKVKNIDTRNWDSTTDFEKVFKMILDRAKNANLSSDDLPSTVITITDLQWNESPRHSSYYTNFESIKKSYEEAGYKMPRLVFWNANAAYGIQSPVSHDEVGTVLVSGASPSLFKQVASLDDSVTPYGIMEKIITDERYDRVIV